MLRRPINQLVAQGIMPCKYDTRTVCIEETAPERVGSLCVNFFFFFYVSLSTISHIFLTIDLNVDAYALGVRDGSVSVRRKSNSS